MGLFDEISSAIGGITSIGAVGGLLFEAAGMYAIGYVPIDTFQKVEHKSDLTITKYPVEGGVNLSDNIVIEPNRVTVSGLITDTQIAGTGMNIVGDIAALAATRVGIPVSRSGASWQMLRLLQVSRVPFVLNAGVEMYDNMVIQSLTATKEKGSCGKLRFTAVCQEVPTVNFQRVGEHTQSVTPTSRDGQQAVSDKTAPKVDNGLKKQKQRESFLSKTFGGGS